MREIEPPTRDAPLGTTGAMWIKAELAAWPMAEVDRMIEARGLVIVRLRFRRLRWFARPFGRLLHRACRKVVRAEVCEVAAAGVHVEVV